MAAPKPFTKRERARLSQHGLHRPVNAWGGGDLPAPWAAGDVVRIDQDRPTFDREFLSRLRHGIVGRTYWTHHGRSEHGGRIIRHHPGFFVVDSAFSVDYGDAWYFRVTDGDTGSSDRMHVGFPERASRYWEGHGCDFMAAFSLVETHDPEGLALREQMIAEGWSCPPDTDEGWD